MNVYAFVSLLALVACIPPLVSTIAAKTWDKPRRLFIPFLGTAILAAIVDFLFRGGFFPGAATALLRLDTFLFFCMLTQFYLFASSFMMPDKSRWLPMAWGSLFLALILASLGLIPAALVRAGLAYVPYYGAVMAAVLLPFVVLLVRCAYYLVDTLRREESAIVYNQVIALFVSGVVLGVFAAADLLPLGREYSFAYIGTGLTALICGYAVVGRNPIDIRFMVRRSMMFVIIGLAALVVFWLLLLGFHAVLKVSVSLTSAMASSLAAVTVGVTIYAFRNFIAVNLGKIVQGEAYYYQQKLMDFSNEIQNVFSLKDQGYQLLKLLVGSLGCRKGALLFREEDSEDFAASLIHPDADNPLTGLKVPASSVIADYLQRQHRPLVADTLKTLLARDGLTDGEKGLIEAGEAELFMPMISRGKLIGILVLDRKTRGKYTLGDFALVEDVVRRVAVSMEKEYLREQQNAREEKIKFIDNAGSIITSSLDIQRSYDNFITELKRKIDVDWTAIGVLDNQELHFLAVSSTVGSPWQAGERIPLKGTPAEWVKMHRRACTEADLSRDAELATSNYQIQQNIKSTAYIPLKIAGEVVGVLMVASRNANAYGPKQLSLLADLADRIAPAVENARIHGNTERMARVDGLTGLLNRRFLDEVLSSEIGRHSRYGGVFSLIILDVDNFKSFNDNYGHLVGDDVLQQAARLMKNATRAADQAFRFGGDEFAILLPQTPVESALAVCERIRQQISAKVHAAGKEVTVSLGVAGWPADGISAKEVIAAADAALYAAKRNGGNRSYLSCRESAPFGNAAIPNGPEEPEVLSNIFALAAAVDARDQANRLRSKDVHEMTMNIAAALEMDTLETSRLATCASLHDIGKIGISDAILNKREALNEHERQIIMGHPSLGATIIGHAHQLQTCVAGVLHHHERYDGRGYPNGLKGEEIPLESRILAIADAFAAMTHPRPYCSILSYEAALAEIRRGAGTQFDPKLVKVFLDIMDKRKIHPEAVAVEDERPGALEFKEEQRR